MITKTIESGFIMGDVKTTEKKSIAKANGLKSTFFIDNDKTLMTSFGKGNSAVLEKMIDNYDVEELQDENKKAFDAAVKTLGEAHIKGRCGESDVVLPKSSDTNHLQAKSTIEKIYFGKTFTDNIHIQIAYNIMDIKKIFAIYANTIVESIDNLKDRHTDSVADKDEFLGMLYTFNSVEKSSLASLILKEGLIDEEKSKNYFFIKGNVWKSKKHKQLKALNAKFNYHGDFQNELRSLGTYLQNQFRDLKKMKKAAKSYDDIQKIIKSSIYFGDAFLDQNGNVDVNTAYTIICLLGVLRQQSFHEKSTTNTWIFEIDNKRNQGFNNALDTVFKNKVDKLNNDFLKNSKVNLSVLFEIYGGEKKSELVKEYYDFSVRKSYKNMGFSIKTLRETILTFEDAKVITDQKYDSVRSKFYSLFDFVIYRYYLANQKRGEDFVDKLRKCVTKEDKPNLYENEAKMLWTNIKTSVLKQIMPKMDGNYIQKIAKNEDVASQYSSALDGIMQTAENTSYFSKTMYCVSLFLDGKEINCLLTSLINKFDNINSLCRVLVDAGYESDSNIFTDKYMLFADSEKITDELRFVNSFARMSKTTKAVKDGNASVNRQMYYDSAALFGEFNKEKVEKLYHLGDVKATKFDKALRNFMINNVINSNRFNYVTRFINPAEGARIMQSKVLVEFALKDIPEAQLIRYCKTAGITFDADYPDCAKMAKDLADMLNKVRFDNFVKVKQIVKADSEEAKQKERYKAIIRLYLTVLYLIVKSLVKVNMSYSIAFGILERDCEIMNQKYECQDYFIRSEPHSGQVRGYDFAATKITDDFRKDGRLNKRVANSIETNKELYKDDLFYAYRNQVAHLNVIETLPNYVDRIKNVKSYFDLYHCILFLNLMENKAPYLQESINTVKNHVSSNGKTVYENVCEHNTVSKDFLYGLNTPFAYNAARYINLSNREKFIEGYGK